MHSNETIILVVLCVIITNTSLASASFNESCEIVKNVSKKNEEGLADRSLLKVLSRKRRYLVFPEGSSFSVACCLTVGMYGNPSYTWISWAVNWGIAYDLPNETYAASLRRKAEAEMPMSVTSRRFRRDLYHRIEVALDNMGFNGEQCILRALCETYQLFGGRGTTMIKELLRAMFSLPSTKVLPFEHPSLQSYSNAFDIGRRALRDSCASIFSECGFSLHGMALGKYSSPPL